MAQTGSLFGARLSDWILSLAKRSPKFFWFSDYSISGAPRGCPHNSLFHGVTVQYNISKNIADLPSIGDITSIFCCALTVLATSALFRSHPFMFFALFPRNFFCLPKLHHLKIPFVLPYAFQHENLKTATGVQHRKCVLCDSAARPS